MSYLLIMDLARLDMNPKCSPTLLRSVILETSVIVRDLSHLVLP